MESAVRTASYRIRHIFGISTDKPWWNSRRGRQNMTQIGIGVNLTLLAVVLPVAWNYVAKQKWETWKLKRETRTRQQITDRETSLVQEIINQRRRDNGLPAYTFQEASSSSISATAAAASPSSSSSPSLDVAEAESLWSKVERFNKQQQQQTDPTTTTTSRSFPSLPIHASEEYLQASNIQIARNENRRKQLQQQHQGISGPNSTLQDNVEEENCDACAK